MDVLDKPVTFLAHTVRDIPVVLLYGFICLHCCTNIISTKSMPKVSIMFVDAIVFIPIIHV